MADAPSPIGEAVHPVRGRRLRLRWSRDLPLTPAEHRAVCALAAAEGGRRWRTLTDLEVLALDGPGEAVAALSFRYGEPDVELAELPGVVALIDRVFEAVPGSTLAVNDPAALLVQTDGGMALRGTAAGAHGTAPAPLSESWRPDPACVLHTPAGLPTNDPVHPSPPPRTEGELIDLLHAMARVGPDRALLRAAAGPGVRHHALLESLVATGVLATSACALLTHLGRRELADVSDLEGAAERLLLDGDRAERQAARELLHVLRPSSGLEHTDAWRPASPAEDHGVVARIGARLLASPSLEPTAGPAAEAWEDDLLGDDLVLLDPDAEVPESPVAQALRSLGADDELDAAGALSGEPGFAARASADLAGDDDAVTGACMLLAAGRWPTASLPGLTRTLTAVAGSDRPWPVRVLALRALGRTGRSDAVPVARDRLTDAEPAVAHAAVRALGHLPGVEARLAVRACLSERSLAAHAVAAAGDGGDPGAFLDVLALADHPDAEVRRSVARHLDRVGGPRAIPALQVLRRSDESWQVQIEAAGGLARQASRMELGDLLSSPDTDVLARLVRALGEADRADAFGLLEQAARHVRSPVRVAAADALGALALTAGTAPLLEMLADANPDVRIAAIRALARCGDGRAVAPLRQMAARDDDPGAAAQRALRTARKLRLPPPDGRVRLRALARQPLLPDHRERVRSALGGVGLGVAANEGGFEATGTFEPRDLAALDRIARVVEALNAAFPGLRWSIRDGMSALRRDGLAWRVSGQAGTVVRDAGWFEEALPARSDRPPLTPHRTADPAFSPLPVRVMKHVKGREQVRIAVDPDRAADPNEVTGEVPGPAVADGGGDDLLLELEPFTDADTLDEGATQAIAAQRSSPRPVRAAPPSDWDDLLSENQSDAALTRIAARGLDDGERDQLRTWLASGLPGIQIAACRVAEATVEAGAAGPIAALAGHTEAAVRVAVARALGALRASAEPAAIEALQALSADPDPAVQSATLRARSPDVGAPAAEE